MSVLHDDGPPVVILRSIGELTIASAAVRRVLRGRFADDVAPDAAEKWRISALQGQADADRVVEAAVDASFAGEALTVQSRDGSRISMTAENISHLADRLQRLARAGHLLGLASEVEETGAAS
ncbi:hypothetical protein FJ656_27970 [Schumannella luteola]|uniref:Uncharacterized protein n=1 Tax=Schumannella luteola TaxID=472059 RepID=A0A852YMU6_9MICO|nr:hypothetical protein [Schumannella luteola]NYG98545.1 hypothetical protein [Schumannella luteola]TPX01234.1 hypothetical protein FJ656_27970 [Schumannella luteola]